MCFFFVYKERCNKFLIIKILILPTILLIEFLCSTPLRYAWQRLVAHLLGTAVLVLYPEVTTTCFESTVTKVSWISSDLSHEYRLGRTLEHAKCTFFFLMYT
jgi:hypothetical protein